MITNPIELKVQRDQTRAFIDANHEVIVLTPRLKVKTSTGGTAWENQPVREPQKFHVGERNSTARTDTRVPGGERREEEFTLVGLWDSVIEANDIFDLGGAQWEVAKVEWENGYERRAAVTRFGR